jgi:hypothetical protein
MQMIEFDGHVSLLEKLKPLDEFKTPVAARAKHVEIAYVHRQYDTAIPFPRKPPQGRAGENRVNCRH